MTKIPEKTLPTVCLSINFILFDVLCFCFMFVLFHAFCVWWKCCFHSNSKLIIIPLIILASHSARSVRKGFWIFSLLFRWGPSRCYVIRNCRIPTPPRPPSTPFYDPFVIEDFLNLYEEILSPQNHVTSGHSLAFEFDANMKLKGN